MITKSYLDLKKEVWDIGTCSGCGACVAVCPCDNIFFMEDEPMRVGCDQIKCGKLDSSESPLSFDFCKVTNYNVKCGACYDACPRTSSGLLAKKIPEAPIGDFIEIKTAKAKKSNGSVQSGGVVTALLAEAFDEDLIDGAIVMIEDKWTMEPESYLATSKEEVLKSSGSRYSWNVPILEALREAVYNKKLKRLAVIGTPCVMDSLNSITSSNNDLLKPFEKAIRFKIGLFCYETMKYGPLMEMLEKEGINPWDIKKMDIEKGKFIVLLDNGDMKSYKIKDLEKLVRTGCMYCKDFTGYNSDISVGNVGSPEGVSTVILRNHWGKGLFDKAVLNNHIEVKEPVNTDEITKLAKMKIKDRKDILIN
ncbi:Coenzyme F420 hydrogenase/dehydrogenase, beta subunit C-terminal domain [Methanococcus voltae]|jgi:coenzyme F420 hydrogenase subunit beta|uniref:Coenzyme F420 hydrogenase subunit beta n=2 Tax=Methanococcus voltae TaxID=2188 RepID=A0A8J7RPG3_METVO|nr:Coenzyme F420 hydrogenase/dehydrogenase, beta subunit C-terminal domain [Methanococcus voltae]MBP2172731.1 coenzyme F420 hydrogenase subunit beta [Methanococcus voltae]MBP2201859.1 coenzyme F420 hydrogenase subunit beta [Methanococcus voltae]MCS3922683.1 coenzyme F420 hydrogenase subunit beta [Methanococcus voltae PS]